MVKVFLTSGLGEGQGSEGVCSRGRHRLMVYEYGFEKSKDQRTESQSEGTIQYFTLAT